MWTKTALTRATSAARAGGLDHAAPVQAHASTTAAAPAATVWDVLADIEAWPSFLPGVSQAGWIAPGGPVAGTNFRWVNAGSRLSSTLEVAAPGQELT